MVVILPDCSDLHVMATYTSSPPSARASPFIASAGQLVYLWGGEGDTAPEAVFTYSHGTETWSRQLTKGLHPPAGLYNGGCTLSGQRFYLYGGRDEKSHHGGLYELNPKMWMWRKVCGGGTGGPGRKRGCKMISYQKHLLVMGGYYDKTPSSRQAGASYELGRTNEVHSYNLTTGKRYNHCVIMNCRLVVR